MQARKLIILAALGMMISGASALDINDSDPLQYYSGGDLDFEVATNGDTDIRGDLIMGSGQSITNYFEPQCGDFRAVKGIYENGTWICTDRILEEKTEYLNETLSAGNVANLSINMSGNNIDEIGDLNSNGTDLNIGGDVDFEENNIQNVNAIQDGGGTNSIILNEDNTVDIENNNLYLSGNTVTQVNDLEFNGGPDSVSGIFLPDEGPNDRIDINNPDGTGDLVRINDDGRVQIVQNNLNVSSNQIVGSAGNLDFSGSQLGVNAIVAANQRVDIRDSMRVRDNNRINFGTDDDISARYDSDNSRLIVENENSGAELLRLNQNGIFEIANGDLNLSEGNDVNLIANSGSGAFNDYDARFSFQDPNGNDIAWQRQAALDKAFQVRDETSGDPLMTLYDQGYLELPNGNLRMNDNSISQISNLYDNQSSANFFQTECAAGNVIRGINANGTYDCVASGQQIQDLYVNESGDNMTGDLNMNGNKVFEIGSARSNFTSSGQLSMGDNIQMNNNQINGVGTIRINDPGVDEGIIWDGAGNARIYEANLADDSNSEGYLQLVDPTGIYLENEAKLGDDLNVSGNIIRNIGTAGVNFTASGTLDLGNRDIIEPDELRTDGSGSDSIAVYDTSNTRDIVGFQESGRVNIPETTQLEFGASTQNWTWDTVADDIEIRIAGTGGGEFEMRGDGTDYTSAQFMVGNSPNSGVILDADATSLFKGGDVAIQNGTLDLKVAGQDAGNDIVNVAQISGRDTLNIRGEGASQGVIIEQGDGTPIINAGTGETDVEIPSGNLDMQQNRVEDFSQLRTSEGGTVLNITNPGGASSSSEIRFRSGVDTGSDYATIRYSNDRQDNTGEDGELLIGVQNDESFDDSIEIQPSSGLRINTAGDADQGSDYITQFQNNGNPQVQVDTDGNLNMMQSNVSDVRKVGFGDGNKIKTESGRMCIGNRCS